MHDHSIESNPRRRTGDFPHRTRLIGSSISPELKNVIVDFDHPDFYKQFLKNNSEASQDLAIQEVKIMEDGVRANMKFIPGTCPRFRELQLQSILRIMNEGESKEKGNVFCNLIESINKLNLDLLPNPHLLMAPSEELTKERKELLDQLVSTVIMLNRSGAFHKLDLSRKNLETLNLSNLDGNGLVLDLSGSDFTNSNLEFVIFGDIIIHEAIFLNAIMPAFDMPSEESKSNKENCLVS